MENNYSRTLKLNEQAGASAKQGSTALLATSGLTSAGIVPGLLPCGHVCVGAPGTRGLRVRESDSCELSEEA